MEANTNPASPSPARAPEADERRIGEIEQVVKDCVRLAYNLDQGLKDEQTIQTAATVLAHASRLLTALRAARTPSEASSAPREEGR